MVYFCADDYGIADTSNKRIESIVKQGALNKISLLPNGKITDFKERLANCKLCLHLNLVEGKALSSPDDADLLVTPDGNFKYSFVGLLFLSLSGKRKRLEAQLYNEIKKQIEFWQNCVGADEPLAIDSHQHTHMIPLVFKTLLRVIDEQGIKVDYLRIPAEPITPYLRTLSLYAAYRPAGIVKQWLLGLFYLINRKKLKASKINYALFMGVMFSGVMTQDKIKKLLPRYQKLAAKQGRDIELAFHPGYVEQGEPMLTGCRKGFEKFYYSPNRVKEWETLINLNF